MSHCYTDIWFYSWLGLFLPSLSRFTIRDVRLLILDYRIGQTRTRKLFAANVTGDRRLPTPQITSQTRTFANSWASSKLMYAPTMLLLANKTPQPLLLFPPVDESPVWSTNMPGHKYHSMYAFVAFPASYTYYSPAKSLENQAAALLPSFYFVSRLCTINHESLTVGKLDFRLRCYGKRNHRSTGTLHCYGRRPRFHENHTGIPVCYGSDAKRPSQMCGRNLRR